MWSVFTSSKRLIKYKKRVIIRLFFIWLKFNNLIKWKEKGAEPIEYLYKHRWNPKRNRQNQ
jgi:hypothetical protein